MSKANVVGPIDRPQEVLLIDPCRQAGAAREPRGPPEQALPAREAAIVALIFHRVEAYFCLPNGSCLEHPLPTGAEDQATEVSLRSKAEPRHKPRTDGIIFQISPNA